MKKPIKMVYGPVNPIGKKIEIPSEKAGEKRVVTDVDLQQQTAQFLELQTNSHRCELAKEGGMKRRAKDGTIILTDKEKREQDNVRGDDR